ncbi:MAG: DUF2177 family protein [Candidatus Comchoanobacterales bacterium]
MRLLALIGWMLLFDLTWIFVVAWPLYQKWLKHVLASPMQLGYAIAVYCVMVFGVWWFALRGHHDVYHIALNAAILGFVSYGVFDLTNGAIIKQWPWQMVVVDMIWGTIMFASTAVLAHKTAVWLGGA